MKKIFYVLSITIITASLILYFNIAGGKSDNANNNPGNIIFSENTAEQTGSETPFSPRSGGWQLQVMPNMGSRLVRDLYFTDSLTGYAVASPDSPIDSANILKTTNGGNNWLINYTKAGRLKRIIFINTNTGYAGGSYLLKTTNAGDNWVVWNWPLDRIVYDMQVFGEDTIWYGDSDPIAGGAYRTTNGGINWEKRDNGIPANSYPDKIYFYNSRIGFAYQSGDPNSYKTTDGGLSWSVSFSGGFGKLFFRDSLNGYRSSQGFYRTSNGGLNWSKDSVPSVKGNVYTRKWITDFSLVNNDTIYAAGASVQFLTNFIYKSLIYKTTNGGINWGYQIPDTSYGSAWHDEIFAIRNNIWAYTTYNNRGIYSSTGGDTTIYVKVNNNSNELPTDFELGQNYPNPFNQLTIIKYQLSRRGGSSTSNVKIKIFDITGKEITVLNEGKKLPGNYEIRFDAGSLGSGIYFYQLIADEKVIQTRKMMLLK